MNRLRLFSSYLVTNITVGFFWILLKVLNRTTVIGRENVGTDPNTLLLSNHQSMIDSFPVGLFAWYPKSWLKPHLIPWNPAAEENFYRNRILGWFSERWRCIPIREGRRDLRALRKMIKVLPEGVMTLFPEGTRTRDGSVGEGRSGAGVVILKCKPKVIPVAIEGMRDVLPVGRYIPRLFRRVHIWYGEPFDYSEFEEQPPNKEVAQELVDRIMQRIRIQHEELRKLRSGELSELPATNPHPNEGS